MLPVLFPSGQDSESWSVGGNAVLGFLGFREGNQLLPLIIGYRKDTVIPVRFAINDDVGFHQWSSFPQVSLGTSIVYHTGLYLSTPFLKKMEVFRFSDSTVSLPTLRGSVLHSHILHGAFPRTPMLPPSCQPRSKSFQQPSDLV